MKPVEFGSLKSYGGGEEYYYSRCKMDKVYKREEGHCEDDDEADPTWAQEAAAVIRDVQEHLKEARVSTVLESDESQIYLNLTTLEGKKVTVKLCARGFCVVSKEAHDTDSTAEAEDDATCHHETLYALLNTISPAYTNSFGEALREKLSRLQ